jgi:hypothetical protein
VTSASILRSQADHVLLDRVRSVSERGLEWSIVFTVSVR